LFATNYTFNFVAGTLTVTVASPVLRVDGMMAPTNAMQLSSAGVVPDTSWRVLASTNLMDWSEIGTAQAGPDGSWNFTDQDAPLHPVRFYRLSGD
jgi:hypothetical protein